MRSRRYIGYWLAGLALPVAVIGVAQLAEYGLSQLVNGDWQISWSLADASAIMLLQLTLGVALVVRRHQSQRIEAAVSAQNEMPSTGTLAYTLNETP